MRQSPFLLRLELLIGSLAILILAQAFNGGLSLASLDTLYTRSIVSGARVVGNDLVLKLEGAVRFGKSIESFYGMPKVLAGVHKDMPELSGVYVAMPDGAVVHSLNPDQTGTTLADLAGTDAAHAFNETTSDEPVVLAHASRHIVLFPIRGPDKSLAGMLALAFPDAVVDQRIEQGLVTNLRMLAISTGAAALLLALGLFSFLRIRPDGSFSRVRLYVVLLVALGGAQIFYSASNITFFREQYLDISHTAAKKLTALVERDIEGLLDKGVAIDKLRRIETSLSHIVHATPEVRDIAVLGIDSRVLNLADGDGAVTDPQRLAAATQVERGYAVTLPLERQDKGGEVSEGFIQVRLSKAAIAAAIREIILDAATVAVIAILFLVEMSILFMIYAHKAAARRPAASNASEATGGPSLYGVIRPVAFLFLFAIDMSLSFIPLRMEELYAPMLGLSKDIILGLPISVEMGAAGLVVALSGPWIDKRGWLEPFVTGLVLCAVGYFFSGAAGTAVQFIAARGFVGLGYGLGLMATQGFVIANTGPEEKARGITHMFAGVYAGSLCGGAAGAMLAQRLGYGPVFYVASAILVLVVLCAVLFLRGSARSKAPANQPQPAPAQPERLPNHQDRPALSLRGLLRFMTNRDVFALAMLSILPSALVLIGFLNYLLPIYLKRTGATQSDIGRILMIYGVCLIYVAPFIGRLVDESNRKRLYITLSGIIGAAGMLVYYVWGGLPAAAAAVLLLGVSASFGFASQNAYALNLRITRELGESTAIGLTNAVERLGQVLGPLMFGWVIAVAGLQHGVTFTGVGYLALTILFIVIARETRTMSRVSASE
ncbi:MFS transporter [Oceanidesulfovibrio marinus]|uniref:MFS transporter n=1 Tax=Oceanidesulfovibrio marinus TaxID=370038 RepID=A0ABX6NJR1_9BACT|nr:MFS transporter [Oceanidesulfovibrio marinus]QJT10904.1 MFS transporter [Oceanidesulfovibrio marinus]